MRNYCKLRAIKWTESVPFFSFTADLYAFGADDDGLMAIVRQYETHQIAQFNPHPVFFSYPNAVHTLYVMLDRLFVAQIANRDAIGFWQDSALGQADGSWPSGVIFPLSTDQTSLESPRATFPSALGTDGQRLKK